jgi:hypothetical protein
MTTDTPPLFKLEQRWRNRRDFYVPPDARFNPRHFGVEVIDEATAKAFVKTHHYAHSVGPVRLAVSLWSKPGVAPSQLVGIAAFTVPMNQNAIPAHTGMTLNQGCELGRLVLLDGPCGFNCESWFVSRAFQALRAEKPEIETVISYSDPVPRLASDGSVRFRGHIGTIYQALSARFFGRSSARTLWLTPNGDVISERGMSKIRSRDRGWRYAVEQLTAVGAPAPGDNADLGEWLAAVKRSGLLRPIKHAGNYGYGWGLSYEARRAIDEKHPIRLPYPRKAAQAA